MTLSEDEDESLAHFLESGVLQDSSDSDNTQDHTKKRVKEEKLQPPRQKRSRVTVDKEHFVSQPSSSTVSLLRLTTLRNKSNPCQIESGIFSRIPLELFPHILKFLSSEDLISCSLVSRFLNYASSDESLWHRLYNLRWGLLPTKEMRKSAWKSLYFERDKRDMLEFTRNCPAEFKEYYIQMQAAKRSQTPLPSQVANDSGLVLDKTIGDQIFMWKSKRGLSENMVMDHACSRETCSYHRIGDVFVCEKTGNVHVCDDSCREAVLDLNYEDFGCKISGYCFEELQWHMEPDPELYQCDMDLAEQFMGSDWQGRAYCLGYNCEDEKELEEML